MGGLMSVGYFLISTLFNLFIFVLWARLFIRYFTISPFLPLSQMIYQFTNPLVAPVQYYILRRSVTKGPYDWACFIVLVIVEWIKFTLYNALFFNHLLPMAYIGLSVLVDLIVQPCNLLFYAIILRVIMSWLMPLGQNPAFYLLYAITEPLLRLIRRLLPPLMMLDFSPLVAMLLLKVLVMFVVTIPPVYLS